MSATATLATILQQYHELAQESTRAVLEQQTSHAKMLNMLLQHPRNQQIYSTKDYHFRVKGRFLRGAHPVLGDFFGSTDAPHVPIKYNNNKQPVANHCKGRGHLHGCRVHHQLRRIAQLALNYKDWPGFSKTVVESESAHRGIDHCVQLIVAWLVKKGWAIVLPEFKIWDERLGVATAIDAVCYDMHQGQCVLVELKTGYNNAAYVWPVRKGVQCCPSPLRALSDCPFHRHAAQLLVSRAILRQCYGLPGDRVPRCCLLLVNKVGGGVHAQEIPALMCDVAVENAFYKRLLQQQHTTKGKKLGHKPPCNRNVQP